MHKPNSGRLWCCCRYYFNLCLAKGQSTQTIRAKRYALKKFCSWCFSNNIFSIDDISIELMDEYTQYLNTYRKPKNKSPLSSGAKYSLILHVKLLMAKMHCRGLIADNKIQYIDLPSVKRSLPKAIFNPDEVEVILEQPLLFGQKGIVHRVMLETLFATGIRRMELRGLDIEDVDLKQNLIRIRKAKGGREYILPISERACEWLIFYLAKIRPLRANLTSGSAMFITNKGTRFRLNALSDMASRYVRLAGFKRPGSCHLFRHTTATMMLNNGADLRHVQEMLGHASISSTQIYTHVAKSKLSEIYNRTHPSALSDRSLLSKGDGNA